MTYDAIVIGGGHNGLVTACYLARAKWRVLVLERRYIVGGACVTEERTFPGYKVSTAAYVNSLFRPEIIRDLRLRDYGFELIERNPSSFSPFPDDRYLMLGADAEFNRREIAKFSPKDAAQYPRYVEMLERVAAVIEPTLVQTPPNPVRPGHRRPARTWPARAEREAPGRIDGRGRRDPHRRRATDPRSLVRVRAAQGDAGDRRDHRRVRVAVDARYRLRAVPPRHGRDERRARRLELRQGRNGRPHASAGQSRRRPRRRDPDRERSQAHPGRARQRRRRRSGER